MAETDEQRQALFDQIEQRTFHVPMNEDDHSGAESGAESDGAYGLDEDDDGGGSDGGGGDGDILRKSKVPQYPSQEFIDRLHDKIIVIGINAFHLAADRDLQRLLLDQTTRLVLSPSEVTHRVAERWMLKKLLDAHRATEAEDMARPRRTQRRLVNALHMSQTLQLSAPKTASAKASAAEGGGGGESQSGGNSVATAKATKRRVLAESRRALGRQAFDVYHDTVMSIAEQIMETRHRKELASRKELLRIISDHNHRPGEEDGVDGGGGGGGGGDNESVATGADDESHAATSLHRCGRTSRYRLPKALAQEAKSSRRPRKPGANIRSWWRLDEDALKWAPRMSVDPAFSPPPYDWGPFERAYAVEWMFLQKAAADFDAAVAAMDLDGVDVFSYQALETAVLRMAGLFHDIELDAADEARLPVVPVGDFVGQRRLNARHSANVKALKDRLAGRLPCSMEEARVRLSESAAEIGEQMALFTATRTVQRTMRGHVARKHARRKRAQVKFAAKKVKKFILRKVMEHVTRLRSAKTIQAAVRGCIQRRRFAEKKVALVVVSYLRDCKPAVLDACWDLLVHCKEHAALRARNAPVEPDILKRGFQLQQRVPQQLVHAFEFCAHIKMPGFGMLLQQRKGHGKRRHRQTLGGLNERSEDDGDEGGSGDSGSGSGSESDTRESGSDEGGGGGGGSGGDGLRVGRGRPKRDKKPLTRSLSERPRTPDAVFQHRTSGGGAGPGAGRRTLSGTDLMFEAHRATQIARDETAAAEAAKQRAAVKDEVKRAGAAGNDGSGGGGDDDDTEERRRAREAEQLRLLHEMKARAIANTVYWWMAHRPPEETPYLRTWNEGAFANHADLPPCDELSAAEDRLLGRRKFAFRKTLLQVRGKRLVHELMGKFRDFERHFAAVGQFSPNVARQFARRPPNSSYLPANWGSKFRLYGVLRDQRQLQDDPSVLVRGFPREGWVDIKTGVSCTLQQWVVQHLVAHSYEDGGVNPMVLYERNRRPKTRAEREEQAAMMAKVAGKPHMARAIEGAMPLVKFAKLLQRHVHLSEWEVAKVIDDMHLRHPELAIVTPTDYARFIRSATVTTSQRAGPQGADDMYILGAGAGGDKDGGTGGAQSPRLSGFAFSALFMQSEVRPARRIAAALRIQRIWRREVPNFRRRRVQRRAEDDARILAQNQRRAREVARLRRLYAVRQLQAFWRRVTNNLWCNVTRRIHPSNFFCRVVPRAQVFRPAANTAVSPRDLALSAGTSAGAAAARGGWGGAGGHGQQQQQNNNDNNNKKQKRQRNTETHHRKHLRSDSDASSGSSGSSSSSSSSSSSGSLGASSSSSRSSNSAAASSSLSTAAAAAAATAAAVATATPVVHGASERDQARWVEVRIRSDTGADFALLVETASDFGAFEVVAALNKAAEAAAIKGAHEIPLRSGWHRVVVVQDRVVSERVEQQEMVVEGFRFSMLSRPGGPFGRRSAHKKRPSYSLRGAKKNGGKRGEGTVGGAVPRPPPLSTRPLRTTTRRRLRTAGSATAEGRARLKNFFGTRLQKRIILEHDHTRVELERRNELAIAARLGQGRGGVGGGQWASPATSPRTRGLDADALQKLQDEEDAREAQAAAVTAELAALDLDERALQTLRVAVANVPVRRYLVVDGSGKLHVRKTESVPENIRRCLAATKLLQKVCRGWRGRQKARRVLEFHERQAVFREQMRRLIATEELQRAAAEEAEERAAGTAWDGAASNADFTRIPEVVLMQPHHFAAVLETHFSALRLTVPEIVFLATRFLHHTGAAAADVSATAVIATGTTTTGIGGAAATDAAADGSSGAGTTGPAGAASATMAVAAPQLGLVSCTAFVRYILAIIDSNMNASGNSGGDFVVGPFPLLPDLQSAAVRRAARKRAKQRSRGGVPGSGAESKLYAQMDDYGVHGYARMLRVALRDPLQRFRYAPCRTSVQIPVQFRGLRDLRRSARLPSVAPRISWVYGHSASDSHASRVVVTGSDVVVYPAGKVVVLVDKQQQQQQQPRQQRRRPLTASKAVGTQDQKQHHQQQDEEEKDETEEQQEAGNDAGGKTKKKKKKKKTKKKKRAFQQRHFCQHTSPVTCVALHPDGVHVVTGQGGDNPHLLVWSTRTLKPRSAATRVPASSRGDGGGECFTSGARFGFVPLGMDVTGTETVRSTHLGFNPERRATTQSAAAAAGAAPPVGRSIHERMGVAPPAGARPFYDGAIHAANFVGAGGRFVVACGADQGHRMGIWDWRTGQLLAYHHNTFKDDASQINDIIPMVIPQDPARRRRGRGSGSGRSSSEAETTRVSWLTIGANHIKFWRYDPHPAELAAAEATKKKKNKKKSAGRKARSRSRGRGAEASSTSSSRPSTARTRAAEQSQREKKYHFYQFSGVITATTDLAGFCNPYFDGDHDIPRRTWAAVCDEASGQYVSGGSFNCVFVWALGAGQQASGTGTGTGAGTTLPPRVLPTSQSAGVHSLAVILHNDDSDDDGGGTAAGTSGGSGGSNGSIRRTTRSRTPRKGSSSSRAAAVASSSTAATVPTSSSSSSPWRPPTDRRFRSRSPSPARGAAANDLAAHLLRGGSGSRGRGGSSAGGGGIGRGGSGSGSGGEPYDSLFAGCGNGVVVEWRRPARYDYRLSVAPNTSEAQWAAAGGGWIPHASYDLHAPLAALNTMRTPPHAPPPRPHDPRPLSSAEQRQREADEAERLARARAKDSLRRRMGPLASPLPETAAKGGGGGNSGSESSRGSDDDGGGGDDDDEEGSAGERGGGRRPWSELDHIERAKRRLEVACARAGFDRDWARLFSSMDVDGSGGLDPDEFRTALRRFAGVPAAVLSDADVDVLFDAVDTSGDGAIQQHEFAAFMNFEQVVAAAAVATARSSSSSASAAPDGATGAESPSRPTTAGSGARGVPAAVKPQFASWKQRRVNYAGTSEFTITSMAPYKRVVAGGGGAAAAASSSGAAARPGDGDHWLVLGCRNGDVWEAQLRTGQLRNVTYGHRARVNSVAPVPPPATGHGPATAASAGACFASCSDKGHLRVWDARQHRQLAHHLLPLPAKAVAASPDGLTVAAGFADGSFALYDLGDVCMECITPQRHAPPQQHHAGGGADTDAARIGQPSSVGFGSSSTRKSFANIGAAAAARQSGRDAADHNSSFHSVSAMAFSPDGSMLAVASNNSLIHVWAARATCVCKARCDFELHATLSGHVGAVTGLDWSSNSGYLRSCCQTSELLYWDVRNSGGGGGGGGRRGGSCQITSGVDSLALRTKWATETCLFGFHAMGIWDAQKLQLPPNMDRELPVVSLGASVVVGSNTNAAGKGDGGSGDGAGAVKPREQHFLLVGTDHGAVQVFNSPCVAADAPHFRHGGGHSGAVASLCHLPRSREFVSVSSADTVMMQWRLEPTRATPLPPPPGDDATEAADAKAAAVVAAAAAAAEEEEEKIEEDEEEADDDGYSGIGSIPTSRATTARQSHDDATEEQDEEKQEQAEEKNKNKNNKKAEGVSGGLDDDDGDGDGDDEHDDGGGGGEDEDDGEGEEDEEGEEGVGAVAELDNEEKVELANDNDLFNDAAAGAAITVSPLDLGGVVLGVNGDREEEGKAAAVDADGHAAYSMKLAAAELLAPADAGTTTTTTKKKKKKKKNQSKTKKSSASPGHPQFARKKATPTKTRKSSATSSSAKGKIKSVGFGLRQAELPSGHGRWLVDAFGNYYNGY